MKTHDFGATYQEGIISAVDAANHKVRCKIPALEDLETAWLSYLTPNAGGNQFYCLPDVGELVAVLLDARGGRWLRVGGNLQRERHHASE